MVPQADVSRPTHRDLQVYAMKPPQIVCLGYDRVIFVQHISSVAIEVLKAKNCIVFYVGNLTRTLELEGKTDARDLLSRALNLIAQGESLWFYLNSDGADAVEAHIFKP